MNSIETATVLSVGQCGADEPQIRRLLERLGVQKVVQARSVSEVVSLTAQADVDLKTLTNDVSEKLRSTTRFRLILINRILDATGESGLELLSMLLSRYPQQLIMLVSNYAEAQDDAVARGALLGFGKRDLASPEVAARLQVALQGRSNT